MKASLSSFVLFIIIMLSAFFTSCNGQAPSKEVSVGEKNQSNTVIKDIPKHKNGALPWYYSIKNEIEKKMRLQTLESGYDSLQIRIWYTRSFNDSIQLLILKKDTSKWSGELIVAKDHIGSQQDSLLQITKYLSPKEPKSNWENLMQQLSQLGIYTLRDSYEIQNYNSCNDGDGVTIEVATSRKYRIYNYPCVREQHNIWQAKKVEQIMELIEEEFGFRRG